jgi:arabinose-5-phosphate isomerase
VLRLEADALGALGAALNENFVKALDLIAAAKGRAVVTGMGKSGHIARKIAATLASTGSPAFYIHPGEASHGDLGMIDRDNDVVIALSNSGETPELSDIIAFTTRFAIPLIAITRQPHSALTEAADVTLLLPDTPEACSLGLAPTTSTTAALALGDAIAVALLDRNGFSPQDFRALHPGGQLGRRLLKVADLMHREDELPLVAPETEMSETLLIMTSKRFGCAGIVDDSGRLIGVITDGDLRRHMKAELLNQRAESVMTRSPKTIRPQALAGEAVHVMNEKAITCLFVVEDERPVGILHIHDCMRAGVV